ncbi:MAG: hypothetical protein ACFFBC_15790 [Promethearchaeota archaeon]
MIEELMGKDFHKVKHLFEERPFIEGLRRTLENPFPKHMVVDNKDDPQTAVIVIFRKKTSY